jgi:5-deoxy-D-glucuronate isomerase
MCCQHFPELLRVLRKQRQERCLVGVAGGGQLGVQVHRVQELSRARVPFESWPPVNGCCGLRERDEAQLDAFGLAVVNAPTEGSPVHMVVIVVQ